MANNFLNGSDLLVYLGTGQTATALGYSRNCSISLSTNMADATTKTNEGYTESIPTTKSWSVDADGLGVWNENIKQFVAAFDTRSPLHVSFKPSTVVSGTTMVYSGTAYIESLDIEAPMEDGVTYKLSLKGSGKLNIATA
ncbi:phage tail tube protein [Pedobacter nyackensis]|uniref:phage tail tube protein n=1 Tax=Pedobacter nyackensis TaxID=475255 RepID=UPI002931D672|nr:phage tail tube protein [Pedobacter nyackensis]